MCTAVYYWPASIYRDGHLLALALSTGPCLSVVKPNALCYDRQRPARVDAVVPQLARGRQPCISEGTTDLQMRCPGLHSLVRSSADHRRRTDCAHFALRVQEEHPVVVILVKEGDSASRWGRTGMQKQGIGRAPASSTRAPHTALRT